MQCLTRHVSVIRMTNRRYKDGSQATIDFSQMTIRSWYQWRHNLLTTEHKIRRSKDPKGPWIIFILMGYSLKGPQTYHASDRSTVN